MRTYSASPYTGLFYSSDRGVTWDSINTGFTDLSFYNIVGNEQFLLAYSRVSNFHISFDKGKSWASYYNGMFPYILVNNVYMDNEYVFAPSSSGMYRLRISDIVGINETSDNLPEKYILYQNYPNPFNPVTKLRFNLSTNSFVKLNVYDVLGRKVRNLIENQMNAGSHTIEFDGKDLSSGIYFYEIEVKDMLTVNI